MNNIFVLLCCVTPVAGLRWGTSTDQHCDCGENGACLVDECLCHAQWEGPTCQVKKRAQFACSEEEPVDDRCMNMANGWGRLKIVSPRRHEVAAKCEKRFWEHTHVPMRNKAQVKNFQQFEMLPKDLGNVLELGAGPYTKTRLILESGLIPRSVQSVTLEDPMLLEYIEDGKVVTSYNHTHFCVPESESSLGGCVAVNLLNVGAEVPFKKEAYDTIVMMNVIEHCADAFVIFSNIYHALKPGGLLVFSDSINGRDLSSFSDTCHPIQINMEFYEHYFTKYFIERGAEVLMPGFKGPFDSYFTVLRKAKA